jgi:hypothetical protein
MADDTVTLALQGDVSLEAYADALSHFRNLVAALASEAKAADVVWQIEDLEYSSAITTVRGVPTNGTRPESIARVVRSYLEVGQALERRSTIPFHETVRTEAHAILTVLSNVSVEAVRFETAEADAIVREQPMLDPPRVPLPQRADPTYGAVTGRVQTLTSRTGLRFTVYDHIHDRAVSCYLVEGQESMMRQMWDRVATVEGIVTRDPLTGRPLTVRKISKVTPLAEAEPQTYQNARGALPHREGDPAPEDVIRRLRDAG